MNIDDAIKQLQDFINAYENDDIRLMVKQKHGDLGAVVKDYEATKVLLAEVERLTLKNKKLLEALDVSYTLAQRYYKNGYMEQIKKLLDEEEVNE